MRHFNQHIIRFITLLLALQLLNLSIYAQDFKPFAATAGSEEVNITETVAEYVVEVLLGHKNAIPEQSQHHKDLHFHKHTSFKAIGISAHYHLPELQQRNSVCAVPIAESYYYLYYREINPPPPKA